MKTIKSKERNKLLDETLKMLLRAATTEIEIDFETLVKELENSPSENISSDNTEDDSNSINILPTV